MTTKPNGRGGSRPGAGRKPKAGSEEIKPAKNQTATSRRGGARPGAGRKPKAEAPTDAVAPRRAAKKESLEPQAHGGALKRTKSVPVPLGDRDMLTLLQDVALGRIEATAVQVRAASAALPFLYAKKGEGGKKDEQADRAKKAASKFGSMAPPPRLVVSNRNK
ncbi:TPA: hypothetical protein QDB15_006756 [Burkholderia vietnamiensis]|uniref:hypothetical protein n=1 Tax=Burkholderia vietnamiensis TaxID=60552 RepID=UPI001592B273|nr:hypothetical protein [Burkholderia vietnamiensis]MCA8212194.1 hypothetical protein [Burkholderia vietnamiensis]MDN8065927.1 hypothetical protein [Burkholderia vietnamiensis]HDR9101136.1 hypothetical protein [Burkholderia vietnamiensis]HDR9122845.1 hypothetical protein [Burkholderia vietnamiensis]HDR9167954.1 hypothetical protein [Burkholderia vietnamiensis]